MEQLEQRITSMELCELINELRVEEKGEEAKVLMHKELMKKIRKELEIIEKLGLNNEKNISLVKYKDKKGELLDLLENEGSKVTASHLNLITGRAQKYCYILSQRGYIKLVSMMSNDNPTKNEEVKIGFYTPYAHWNIHYIVKAIGAIRTPKRF